MLLVEMSTNLLESGGAERGRPPLSVMSTPFDHVRRRCVSAAVIVFCRPFLKPKDVLDVLSADGKLTIVIERFCMDWH